MQRRRAGVALLKDWANHRSTLAPRSAPRPIMSASRSARKIDAMAGPQPAAQQLGARLRRVDDWVSRQMRGRRRSRRDLARRRRFGGVVGNAPRLGSARAHAGRAEPLATSSFKVKAESDFFFSGRARARRMYARLTKSAAAPSLNFFIIQTPTGLLSRVLLVSRTCRIKSRWRAWETSRQKVTYPVDGIC